MRKDTKRAFDWSGRIEHLEDRLMMSADPLGGLIEHHTLIEEPPALDHHQESTPDFWMDLSDEELLDDQLHQIDQALANAHNLTGLTSVRDTYGFTGVGQTVAVIDSGIAYDHFALGAGYGGDYRVVGGWDFAEGDANPYDDGPEGSHGTHVSGIVGADTGTYTGVAPGVDLVGLRVFDDAGAGYFSWVESALQWVHDNRNSFESPITAVNLSLGVASWNSDSIPSWAMLEDEFAQLETDGIFIAVSAGNSFTSYNTTGLSYPAASPYVVPVMSVDDNGQLSYFSQRHSRAIAAPGRTIVSTVPDYVGNGNGITDDYASYSGTSMASPYVAGSSVLIRQAMEFAGYTNITEDMIYDHMVATADQFYDSATDQWYNRLNMSAAIDALMPADDYGSTTGEAYDLGALGDSRDLSGVISTLSDVDYFRFTAGATGTVTFDAGNLTHELEAAWQGSGTASGDNNENYTIDVTAGQTYTVGFSTSDGLGYYDLEITSEASFTYTDWGGVAFTQLEGLSLTGENWYRVQSTSSGYLSVEGLYDAGGGTITLDLFSSDMQHLATGNAAGGVSRVDAYGAAGTEYYVCVLGSNSDVDFRLSNLVSINGTTVEVAGTAGDDVFSFTAGSTHLVSVNGVSYDFAANSITSVNFTGGAGNDTISMTGTAGDEIVTIRTGSATVRGAGFELIADNVEDVDYFGSGGDDRAYLFDSTGDDVFASTPRFCIVQSAGFRAKVSDCYRTYAYASGGYDRMYFFDSPGDDIYWSDSEAAKLYGANFHNRAEGFERTYAYSREGNDKAYFFDSEGDDIFWSDPERSKLYGFGFHNLAEGFYRVYAYSTQGNDRAYLYDSAGNDIYWASPDVSKLYGTGFHNRADGFHRVYAYATGGHDIARFHDSTGDDRFWSNQLTSKLYGAGFHNRADGFEKVYAYSSGGVDDAILDSTSVQDEIYGRDNYAALSLTDCHLLILDFCRVTVRDESGQLSADVEAADYFFEQIGV